MGRDQVGNRNVPAVLGNKKDFCAMWMSGRMLSKLEFRLGLLVCLVGFLVCLVGFLGLCLVGWDGTPDDGLREKLPVLPLVSPIVLVRVVLDGQRNHVVPKSGTRCLYQLSIRSI